MRRGKNDTERIKMLADEYIQRIIVSTSQEAKSAQQLSEECNIPLPTCHRKLREMEKAGLIKFSDVDSSEKGRLIKLYTCELESYSLVFEKGEFKFKAKMKSSDVENGRWIVLTSSRGEVSSEI
jgi:predicted ArsR family transcriptional regulator